MTTTTDSFALSGPREQAFWAAVQALGVDLQASALTLVRAVLALRDQAAYTEAFGAATELRYHLDKGRPVEFRQRPIPLPVLPVFGPEDPLRAGYDGPGAEVFADDC